MSPHHDRISDLPDELLVHILSLLPTTTQRAATSPVSRRWRNLWTLVPSIDFTSSDSRMTSYIGAVDGSIRLSAPPHLARFQASVWHDVDNCREKTHATVDRWIGHAASRSVLELCLEFTWSHCPNPLPRSLISCSPSLKHLRLDCCDLSDLPFGGAVFGCLETMWLRYVKIPSEKFAALLSSCPNLADLSLISCNGLSHLELSSSTNPQLINLKVGGYNLVKVALELVSLRHLDISITYPIELQCLGSMLLKEASIHIKLTNHRSRWVEETWKLFVIAISQVEILAAGWSFFKIHGKVGVTFENLRILRWDAILFSCSFKSFMAFVALRCPSLEELHIDFNYVGFELGAKKSSSQLGEAGRMKNYTIKYIKFNMLTGRPRDMELIKLLLGVSTCLEDLHLEFAEKIHPATSKELIFMEISRFPMASQRVSIISSISLQPMNKDQTAPKHYLDGSLGISKTNLACPQVTEPGGVESNFNGS